ncbi:hypothetical protein AB4Z17_07790 [Paenibacillus sp. TAF43_2]|uniref:hypothetical protein n=1 Tax=Paenibacillus sp. TAF43_2 TaxID=3233069 RepID=UPI003F95FD47
MNILLAFCAVLMFIIQTLALKQMRSTNNNEGLSSFFKRSSAYTAIIAIGFFVSWLMSDLNGIHTATLVLGVFYGLVFVLTVLFYSCAMNTGPLSYSAFYFSASLLLPVVASVVLWNEPMTGMKFMGIALFILSFYFINVYGSKGQEAAGLKWLVYCLLAFILNGTLPIIMKWQQTLLAGHELIPFMCVGFGSAFLFSLIGILFTGGFQRQSKAIPTARELRILTLYIVAIAGSTGTGNAIITYLSGRMSGLHLFPLVNGSMIVLLTILSAVLFKEKMSRGGIIGIGIGLLAIVFVNM